ncbi:MAG: hypothetical protein MRY64_00595 [Hyphomonadaceae bacterium]|nr:hypothetical protein [Hyphomonadaceae bacterium]
MTGKASPFPTRAFLITLAINAVWINVSEVFRYFVFVMGSMRRALPELEGVAPMNFGVFLVWGVWDTILLIFVTGFVWLWLERFGYGVKQALVAATLFWAGVFGILWIGIYNMNLADLSVLATALPLAWLEMAVAGLIVTWGLQRFGGIATQR